MKREIVYLIGPSTETRGGIGYVIGTYLNSSLAARFELFHIVTQREGGAFTKSVTFAKALCRFAFLGMSRGGRLVHIHSSVGTSFLRKVCFFFIARCMGLPVIFQFHSGHFLDYYSKSGYSIKCLIEHVLRSTRLNVALTESWARTLKACMEECAPVAVIGNPINTSVYKPGPRRTGRSEAARLVFLGAIIKNKGVYDLVESAKLLKSQGLEPHFTIAGDREIDQLKAHCKAAGVEDLFEFPGWVSETKKLSLLWDSDLLILPSYAEGLPLCVLEAMACGLPIVCTGVGGLSDLVQHGENGLLFRPGEIAGLAQHISTLLKDDSMRRRIADNNVAKINRDYAVEMVAKRIEKLYSEVGAAPPAASAPPAALCDERHAP